jgi:hypothetical protein
MLATQILEFAKALPEGSLLSAKRLLHLGTRAGIDQALGRMVKAGQLMRVGRGRYVLPQQSRFGALAPETAKVVEALEIETGEAIVSAGIAAANALGMTTQVPMRETYVTAGKACTLRFGRLEVRIQHVPRWQTLLPRRPAGNVIRAMAWLGPNHAGEKLRNIKGRLPASEWQALTAVAHHLPGWLAKTVSEVQYHG